jgi:hypothetical protein
MLIAQARLAAPSALRALEQPSSWTVLQVHAEACNLGDAADRVVALVTPAAGAGPFSIVVELPQGSRGFADHLAAGGTAEQRPGWLVLGDLWVQLEGAQAWQPRPAWEALRASGSLPRWLDELATLLASQAPPGSLADGLDAMLGDRVLENAEQGDLGRMALARAVEAGGKLVRGLAAADLTAAGAAASELAGLGAGLTPAGDDFLVGGMLALWSSADSSQARRACQTLLDAAGPKTNRLSRAWLRAAAEGEAAEAWHGLVRAVIQGEAKAVRRAGEQIIRQGHTSGADALTGYVVISNKNGPEVGAV